ncbi:hypothetical protein [uncultured Rhodoblastus sp.]|uniref:hypothetical protein n=1 Tax=uncultured Rhodoblastus sp. TaxID=543037 RepID=UPI0025E4C80D|nr:hypothetical protein [uncultured Rhodoblastus sp.]
MRHFLSARPEQNRLLSGLLAALVAMFFGFSVPALAQAQRSDSGADAQDARNDALTATPNLATPTPQDNLFATAPALEAQVPAPRFGANLLLPFGWDSNPAELGRGGPTSWGTSPNGSLSLTAPLGSNLRFTASGFGEANLNFSASQANRDRLGGSARLQYVDLNNDQAFSPYAAFSPRWQFGGPDSFYQEQRQDFNLGLNKRFNFDGGLQPIRPAGDTGAATVWSLGLNVFGQIRQREPFRSSDAVFVISSLSYVISQDWNASLAVEFLGRWYERNSFGAAEHDYEALPIATLEYVIPAAVFGGEANAKLVGRPALDLQGSHLYVWSTAPGVSYGQWDLRAAFRMGWRF